MNPPIELPEVIDISCYDFEAHHLVRRTPDSHLHQDYYWCATDDDVLRGVLHLDGFSQDLGYTVFGRDKHGVFCAIAVRAELESEKALAAAMLAFASTGQTTFTPLESDEADAARPATGTATTL